MREKRRFLAAVLLLPLGLLLGTVGVVEGQRPAGDPSPMNDHPEASMEISPCGAPPGTIVTVQGRNLPPTSAVHIGFGGVGLGFEGLAFVLTTPEGLLEEAVEVPLWANPERQHRFLIHDLYFERILVWRAFHVTDSTGELLRRGEAACPEGSQDASGPTAS